MTDIPDEWRNIVAAEIAEHAWQPLTVRYAIADATLAKLKPLIAAYVANQIADAIDAAAANDELCGPWCNDKRGACQDIAARVKRIVARGWSP